MTLSTTKEMIKIGDKVRVENQSMSLRIKPEFKDFEGIVKSIYMHIFGFQGEIKTKEGIRQFDTEVHNLVRL